MAKKYTKNIKLEFAYQKVFSNINAIENIPIHDVIILESGDNLPKRKMQKGEYSVYGGGGATDNKHNNYNVNYNTVGIGRVGARCGCIFNIKSNSWVTDNALYIKSYDKRFYLSYLKHFLSFSNLNQYANNAMQPVISKTRIKSIAIPLVDLGKQKDISALLDSIEFERDCDIKGFEDVLHNVKAVDIWKDLVVEVDDQQTLLKKLRQSILQEAIEGKLTASWREQNPDVESASVLLEKIKAEKEQLVKDKKIKKQKTLPLINEDEIPFDIPESWEWCRLEEVSNNIHYGFNASAKPEKYDVRLLRITDIQNNSVNWDRVPGCNYDEKDLKSYSLNSNDILIARTGGTIGKSYIVKDISVVSLFASYLIRVIPNSKLNANFLKLFIESPLYWKQLYEAAWGAGQPNVNGTSLSKLVLVMPPLQEQKEIVKKIENLFKICDELETQIDSSKVNSEMLMRAVLKEAFEDDQ